MRPPQRPPGDDALVHGAHRCHLRATTLPGQARQRSCNYPIRCAGTVATIEVRGQPQLPRHDAQQCRAARHTSDVLPDQPHLVACQQKGRQGRSASADRARSQVRHRRSRCDPKLHVCTRCAERPVHVFPVEEIRLVPVSDPCRGRHGAEQRRSRQPAIASRRGYLVRRDEPGTRAVTRPHAAHVLPFARRRHERRRPHGGAALVFSGTEQRLVTSGRDAHVVVEHPHELVRAGSRPIEAGVDGCGKSAVVRQGDRLDPGKRQARDPRQAVVGRRVVHDHDIHGRTACRKVGQAAFGQHRPVPVDDDGEGAGALGHRPRPLTRRQPRRAPLPPRRASARSARGCRLASPGACRARGRS